MRTNFLIGFFILIASFAFAQNSPGKDKKISKGKSATNSKSANEDSEAKPFNPSDTMNVIPASNYSKLSFAANYGIAFYTGDIPADAVYPGFGGYVKYSFNHIAGIRLQYLQGQFSGATHYPKNATDYEAFKTSVSNVNLQFLFNLGSIDYRQSFPRNNYYFGVGVSRQNINGSRQNADTPSNVTKTINETFMSIPLTFGYKRKLTKNFDVGMEFNYMIGSSDNLDLKPMNALSDANGYFVASVVYNLTTKNKPTHMDWSNPIDKIYRNIKDAKDQADSMKLDTDQDGVPDYLDQESNTPKGLKVDSKGVTLDSDNDGTPDSNDSDPFGFGQSLSLYFPSGTGVGLQDSSGEIIYKFNDSIPQTEFVTISKSGYGLPTIIFPPNRFTVHVDQYMLLQQIARILIVDTSAALVIIGHADNNKPNFTQLTLAEKRALEVKRKLFKIYEIDERRLLVFSCKDPYIQKFQVATEGLDRKVEFRIIRPVQKRQPRLDLEDLRKK